MAHSASTAAILSCDLEHNGDAVLYVERPDLEVGRPMTRLTAFHALQDKNRSLYGIIRSIASKGRIGRSDLIHVFENDGDCRDLKDLILGARFPISNVFLEDIFKEVLSKSVANGVTPVIEIDRALSFIPWEIIPFGVSDSGEDTLLGEHFVFVSNLLQHEELEGQYGLIRKSKVRKNKLSVRAAGDSSVAYANAEKGIINALPKSTFANSKIATAIKSDADVDGFFRFFSNDDYDVFHFFGHCSYGTLTSSTSQFELSFSDDWKLSFIDFTRARARFSVSSIGFLNVCSSLPTSPNSGATPADYFVSQHGIQFLLATLFPVRGSEAAGFAKIFYDELIPSVVCTASAQYASALMKSRSQSAAAGDLSPLFYRPVGDATVELLSHEKMQERVYG